MRDPPAITLIDHLNCAPTPIPNFVRPQILRLQSPIVSHLSMNHVLELFLAMLKNFVDDLEGLAFFQLAIIMVCEDLGDTMDGVEDLVDNGVEVAGGECVGVVEDVGKVSVIHFG